MILVTGVGRCGTSALMQYFINIGLRTGKMSWHKRYDAGNENPEVLNINNKFRKRFMNGLPMKNAKLYEMAKQVDYDVVKDPQFLTFPSLINHWAEARDDIRIIYCTRKPEHIVESLRRIPEMTSPVYRSHADLIVQKQNNFLARLDKLELPYTTIEFPHFMHFPEVINWVLEEEGLTLPDDIETVWRETFQHSKVHIK